MKCLLVLLGLLTFSMMSSACSTLVAPRTDLLAGATANAPFSHEALTSVLAEFADASGNVDYASLHENPDELEQHYAAIARRSPDSHPEAFPTKEHRLAYWLNAYNTAAILSAQRLYPIDSVADVGTPFWLFFLPDTAGFFYLREHVFGGEAISLYDLENEVVRQRFRDPRIHFALNCASAGCPRLPRRAFSVADLDRELERETYRFFAEARNLSIDHKSNVVRMSSIMQWYAPDFVEWLEQQGEQKARPRDYAARYAPEAMRAELSTTARNYAVEFTPYDWRLNDRGLVR